MPGAVTLACSAPVLSSSSSCRSPISPFSCAPRGTEVGRRVGRSTAGPSLSSSGSSAQYTY